MFVSIAFAETGPARKLQTWGKFSQTSNFIYWHGRTLYILCIYTSNFILTRKKWRICQGKTSNFIYWQGKTLYIDKEELYLLTQKEGSLYITKEEVTYISREEGVGGRVTALAYPLPLWFTFLKQFSEKPSKRAHFISRLSK